MYSREFKGVWIPKEIWLDPTLSMLDKGILAEIDSLDNDEEGCWASNDYIADFCHCSSSKVSKSIAMLIERGYIKNVSFDGRKRNLKSCVMVLTGSLAKNARQTSKKCQADKQKMLPINIPISIENNNTVRKGAQSEDFPHFAEFWTAYPRKTSKQTALKAWKKLGADDSRELLDTILADIRRRVNGEWAGKEIQYVPHPATYLNQRRWEDETATTDKVEAEEEHDLPLEEILRRGDDCSVPEGLTPCGGW